MPDAMTDAPRGRFPRRLALAAFASLAAAALTPGAAQPAPPAWMRGAAVYEVNVRQATPEGTFAAFRSRLPRLRAMGVEVLWFMPIQPIGVLQRKGRLGSYYSIRDYRGINPEFGTAADFRALVADAHRRGFKVILDWVANHTAHDAAWVATHPDWYVRRADGTISNPIGDDGKETDWTDVAELDFGRPSMRRQMLADMVWWVRTYGLDGFRCDMAHLVPGDFWREARAELDRVRPGLFLLAESEEPTLHPAFHATYAWGFHHLLNDVGRGRAPAGALLEHLAKDRARFPASAMRLTFTTNHDENSWAGSEFERLGPNALAAWVVAATVERSLPLVYTGQEDANAKRLAFFEKDTVRPGGAPLDDFFRTLLTLKRRTPALHNAPWGGAQATLAHEAGDRVLAFTRGGEGSAVAVFVNFRDAPATVAYRGLTAPGAYVDAFSGVREALGATGTVSVPAHGWRVFSRQGLPPGPPGRTAR